MRQLLDELEIIPPVEVLITCQDFKICEGLRHAATPTHADLHLSCDNQDVVQLDLNPIFHAKTKHIESKHYFVRERVLEEEISVEYIHTEDNPANLLTKPLPRHKFDKH